MERDWNPTIDALRTQLGEVIRGKPEVVDLMLVGVLAGGHVLLEDVPGVGKTTLAKALARVFCAGLRIAGTRPGAHSHAGIQAVS